MSPKPLLLRKQLVTWLFVPLSALLAIDALVSYWVALSFSQRAYDRSLVEIARDLSLHVRINDGQARLDLPDAARRVLFTDPDDRIHFEVADAGGAPVAGESLPAAPAEAQTGSLGERLYGARVQGETVRVVEFRMTPEPGQGTAGPVIRVAETEFKRRGLAREILVSVLLPQVLLIAIAALVVWVGVQRGLAPLVRVQEAVASRSARDFSPLGLRDVPAELHPVLEAINVLLVRLQAALSLQARFVADAAHQLKTPVAALQAQLELAVRERAVDDMRASVERSFGGLDRLARLVSQLLSLARNEPHVATVVRLEPLDLNALAFTVATEWVPEALRKGIDLGFEGAPQAVMIRGEAGRLHELLDNLLDNAVRYTREGGRITVRVDADPTPVVAVNDDGPSIPPEERTRVFERFHRLLGSSRDGSGLGLSIAREIAHLHGATILLDDDADGVGNTFSVRFPGWVAAPEA